MQPLTHHEIIGLVEPFARRGRHVDLGASQRLERRLAFRPVAHGPEVLAGLAGPLATIAGVAVLPPLAAPAGLATSATSAANAASATPDHDRTSAVPGLLETLTLEHPYEDTFKLTRELRLDAGPLAGLAARLRAEGPDAGQLLQHLEAVAPQRQFIAGDGYFAALSHRLDVRGAAADLVLTEAQARVPGYTLSMRVPRVQGMSAEVELVAGTPGSTATLPQDLLAVIGWDWSPLEAKRDFWQSKVRLRGGGPRRSAGAEAKLARTLQHLGHTLMRPPTEFHERHAAARWGVVFRRGIPLLTVVGMFAGVAALPRMDLDEMSPLRMFAFHLPTLLLAIAFTMQELPRFEIPPLPRRLKMAAWTTAPAEALPEVPRDASHDASRDAPPTVTAEKAAGAAPAVASPPPPQSAPAAPTPPLEPTR